jgi:ParB/RepB/Spo0J family partition protein
LTDKAFISTRKRPPRLLAEDIQLSLIDDNPFNARLEYSHEAIKTLAVSLKQFGLLSPIKLRASNERYQIVYGHRRVRAARLLGWSKIKAEVNSFSDKEMLQLSLAENACRKDLSDYEIALVFKRIAVEFGNTYEEIGSIVGYSKTHVCNYLRMTRLFDDTALSRDASLLQNLCKISEHHARILLQVEDPTSRENLLRIVVSERLSVRDLERICRKLKGWFQPNQADDIESGDLVPELKDVYSGRNRDLDAIRNILVEEFSLPHGGDFETFVNLHSYGPAFTLYSIFSKMPRLENESAAVREKQWFYDLAPKTSAKIQDLRVQFFGNVAIGTLHVRFSETPSENTWKACRGTVCFVRKSGRWKIIHEHWSEASPAYFGDLRDFVAKPMSELTNTSSPVGLLP